jgi:hypothetical protein
VLQASFEGAAAAFLGAGGALIGAEAVACLSRCLGFSTVGSFAGTLAATVCGALVFTILEGFSVFTSTGGAAAV